MEEMKGGRFHIKALSVISALKNTEAFRRFTMDARACVEWRGGPNFFRLVAMASPEALRRNGEHISYPPLPAFDGRHGISLPPPECELFRDPNVARRSAERLHTA